jgi:hypothetical protein
VRRDLSSGREEELTPPRVGLSLPYTVSPDGATLLYQLRTPRGDFDLYRIALAAGAKPEPLLATPHTEVQPAYSPDGRLIAFLSNEAGPLQIYVAPASEIGSRVPVLRSAAVRVRWSRDGRELNCLMVDGSMVAAPVEGSAPPSVGTPRTLFRLPPGANALNFDVAPDGRFLLLLREQVADAQPLTVVLGALPGRN